MAGADDGRGGPWSSRRSKPSRKSASVRGNDWARSQEDTPVFSPRRTRGRGNIEEPLDVRAPYATAQRRSSSRTITTTASPPSLPPLPPPFPPSPPPTTFANSQPRLARNRSMRTPNSAAPVLPRAATVPHRRPTVHLYGEEEEDTRSRSESRRSDSRRDPSLRSAQQYRSTPVSRHTPRSESSESDGETDVTSSGEDDSATRYRTEDTRSRRSGPVHARRTHPETRPEIRGRDRPPFAAPPTGERGVVEREKEFQFLPPQLKRGRTEVRPEARRRDEPEFFAVVTEEPGEIAELERETYAPAAPLRKQQRHPRRSDDIIYEEDSGRRSRYAASYADGRSRSRHSADWPRRPRIEHRNHSLDGTRSRSRSKMSSRRFYESEIVSVPEPPSRARTPAGSNLTRSHSVASTKRSSFAPEMSSRLVECIACMDDEKPVHKTAKLECGHRMCHSCLKSSFRRSIAEPQQMPPRCCTADPIPLKHVQKLFDNNFKKTWNRKFAEYKARNRIYCPSRSCGQWIKPENIRREDGRKVARCNDCRTKVCCSCNGKLHNSRECPRGEETRTPLEQAKHENWQQCYRCKAIVEQQEGRNHMACRCGAEFCMICAAKWKTCECLWFNYEGTESDYLDNVQTPTNVDDPFQADPFGTAPPSPREFRTTGGTSQAATMRPRPQNYDEEILLRRLRDQRDGGHVRRTQGFGDLIDDDHDEDYHAAMDDIPGIGSRAGPYSMVDDFRRPTHNTAPSQPPAFPPAPPSSHAPFERASSGIDYVSGVNKARRIRATSLERRLADRFNPELRQSPTASASRPTGAVPAPSMHSAVHPQPHQHSYSYPGPHAYSHLHTHAVPPVPSPMVMPMPAAPKPPSCAPASVAPLSRRRTMEDDHPYHDSSRSLRSSERERERERERGRDRDRDGKRDGKRDPQRHKKREQAVIERPRHGYELGEVIQTPSIRKRHGAHRETPEPELESDEDDVDRSAMAGLSGPDRGMGRVWEWRNHVEPGRPEGEEVLSIAS